MTAIRPNRAGSESALGAAEQAHEWWHSIGHGVSARQEERETTALGGEEVPRDETLIRTEVAGCGRRNPLVFLNACRTGIDKVWRRSGAGRPEAFRRAVAVAFLGTLRDVVDEQACRFAKGFYRRLLVLPSRGGHGRAGSPASASTPSIHSRNAAGRT